LLLALAACGGEEGRDAEVERLLAALLNDEPGGAHLAELGPEHAAAAPRLVEVLRADSRRHVRTTVAEALGRMGNRAAAPALAEAAAAHDPTVRLTAALAHWRLTHEPEPGLRALLAAARGTDPPARERAMVLLGRAGELPPEELRAIVSGTRPDAPDRAAHLRICAALGPQARDALPHVGAALDAPDAETRLAAAWALHRVAGESEEAARRLLADMARTKGMGRGAMLSRLLATGADAPAAVRAAARPWLDDSGVDESMRCTAIHLFEKLDGTDALDRLRALAASDEGDAVTTAAARAVAHLSRAGS
jgi:HEAT repeat protein